MSILIVDDSPDNLQLLKTILEGAGYKDLLFAESAPEAFKQLSLESPPKSDLGIDLILMDILMPEVDGIEACRQIKEVEHLRDIPIVMVSAKTEVEGLQLAFAAGAVDFIAKPPNKVELVTRVRSVLRLKREMDRRKAQELEFQELKAQLEEANKALMRLSAQDALTGVLNRRRFEDLLDQEWRLAAQKGKPLSLILLDLDFFKAYNDTYGVDAGDEYLQQVATVLTSCLRSDSPKRPGDIVARYGGDEFAALLRETPVANAKIVVDRLREALRSKVQKQGSDMKVLTASIGYAGFPDHGQTKRNLLHKAEQAMFRAKDLGRNRICLAGELEGPVPA